jgi:hypothetical protein
VGLAAVWWYQGAWCKVVHRRPDHRAIVAALPGLLPRRAGIALAGIGVAETALGAWVLTGRRPRAAALAQTAAVIAVTTGGLAVAPERVRRPGRLLARNGALAALAWLPAAVPAGTRRG